MFARALGVVLGVVAWMSAPRSALAIINQVDGTIVPQEVRLQQCLDKSPTASTANPAPGEGPGVLNAVRNANTAPQTFLPATRSDGRRVVTFTMVGEGAGYQNRFGWYNVEDLPFAAASRREVFDCRASPTCACPCPTGPRGSMRPDGTCTHWLNANIVEVDFDCLRTRGAWRGGPVAFYILTPELLAGGSSSGSCAAADSTVNRVYSTDNRVNDDGDYVHFLIYTSRTFTNAYYFGWEDLFRGGDNDFEDALVRAVGLVPTCNPTPELCDGRDNNCNGMIDEGLGTATCGEGACRRTVDVCVSGRMQSCTPGAGSPEVCDGLDNDCDGQVDEGVTRPCTATCGAGTQYCTAGVWGGCVGAAPTPELCDNVDNDCNGMVDEGLTRACRTGCGPGVEACRAGVWGGCTAPTPMGEVCNGRDDDCNGMVDDGIAPRDCRSVCGPGLERCVGGRFVCNAPTPRPEVCDNEDNDCNGLVDDGVPDGGPCGEARGVCRPGRFQCVGGRYTCVGATAGGPEVCDGLDNNCDGNVDEGNPGGGAPCDTGAGGSRLCMQGRRVCRAGVLVCEGGVAGTPEVCNCRDDDCDGRVDNVPEGSSLCPGGGRCLSCECRTPCRTGEFPCSAGLVCNRDNFCVPPLCGTELCREEQVCEGDRCVDRCAALRCAAGQACVVREGRAVCVEDNCYGRGCEGAQICLRGRCVNNPCVGRRCSVGQFCRPSPDGTAACVVSCGEVQCSTGQSCRDGVCARDPCAAVRCAAGQSCRVEGALARCVADPCQNMGARAGRVCIDGAFVDDVCAYVTCPGAPRVVCARGQCLDPDLQPLVRDRVVAAGGHCEAAPGRGARGSGALALLGFVVVAARARRRRRRGARPSNAGAALLGAAALAGCDTEPYCINCGLPPSRLDAATDARADARAETPETSDACRVTNGGVEVCDGLDNDCNGRVDDTAQTRTDARNCGRCGNVCMLPHAVPTCEMGECRVRACDSGWYDLNPAVPGCEYRCSPTGTEVCDGVDNDCNGLVDEGFDLRGDVTHCGTCTTVCAFGHATAACVDGMCRLGACAPGYLDLDRDGRNGCEYACVPSGMEQCDGRDNNCDGRVDEGFDTMTDAMHCGGCGRVCNTPNATPRCVAGRCVVGSCRAGFADIDRDPSTGCEWSCGTPGGASGPEVCDGRDNDCNGLIDDGMVRDVGTECGASALGVCLRGTNACVGGALLCVGATMPGAEFCNGLDDDCDGTVDNAPPGGSLPGTGAGTVCGTNVGVCRYGSFACTAGRVACMGFTGPSEESCDGLDNDCDGRTDEDVTPPPSLRCNRRGASDLTGVCALAVRACDGVRGWGCRYPSTYRDRDDEALCDGLDNNCDGRTDEGCLAAQPASDVRLDRAAGNSIQPVITGNGLLGVGVAYIDRRNGASDIYFARSINHGASFEADLRLDTNGAGATSSVQPALAWLPGGADLVAAWSDFRTSSQYRDLWASAAQGTSGASWLSPDRRANGGQTSDAFGVRVAMTAGNLVAVWEVLESDRSRHVYASVSRDRGGAWSSPTRLDRGPGSAVASTPALAVGAPGRVYVVWKDNRSGASDIFVRTSPDGGVSWSATDTRLDTDTAGSHASELPSVAADAAGNVYVAWQDVRDGVAYDVYANRSRDHGASWLPRDLRVDRDPFPHDSLAPTVLALPGGAAAIVWQDFRWGLPNVYASQSADAGGTWAVRDVPVEAGLPGRSRATEVRAATASGAVFAVWSDNRSGALDIYSNYSLDGGLTFQPADLRLDTHAAGAADSEAPELFAAQGSDGRLVAHVVWVDRRADGVTGDIYYRSLR